MAELLDHYNANWAEADQQAIGACVQPGNVPPVSSCYQIFTPVVPERIDYIKLLLEVRDDTYFYTKTAPEHPPGDPSSAAGNVIIEIREIDVNNHPTANVLATYSFPAASLPTFYAIAEPGGGYAPESPPPPRQWKVVVLPEPAYLKVNTKYAIMLWATGDVALVGWYEVGWNYGGDFWVMGGVQIPGTGTQWVAKAESGYFECWGEALLRPPIEPSPEDEEIDVPKPEDTEATDPIPADKAIDVPLDLKRVRFKQGGGATGYKIYTNFDVQGLGEPVWVADIVATDAANPTVGTPEEYLLTTELSAETEYTWRVDATAGDATATGDVWTFTTIKKPEQADCVTPIDNQEFLVEYATQGSAGLEWLDPGFQAVNKAMGYDLYFGHTELSLQLIGKFYRDPVGFLDEIKRIGTTATAFEVNDGNYYTAGSNYAWRVDSWNRAGRTLGDVWAFIVRNEGSPGDGGGERPDNPDDDDDPGGEDYNGNITTAGGGRHNAFLIVVSHKTVYVRQA